MKFLRKHKVLEIQSQLEYLYGSNASALLERLIMLVGRYGVGMPIPPPRQDLWSEKDAVLITYADMVREPGKAPLRTLRDFLGKRLKGVFSTVHLLPFFPWSSDDGFSVIDYRKVDPGCGTWQDVEALGRDVNLMFDLVLNHCSAKSEWFRDFITGIAPARHYFIEADPQADLSAVVRPRPWPLLTDTPTRDGSKWVWTTFSEDQVDLNWQNPDVLFEFLDILFLYVSKGMRIVRLDAIAFLWKELGTSCIHLPQTHEVVRLIRNLLEMVAPHVLVLTETNVPHEENISYFGNGYEAHMVYNFSLPPLLLHGLLKENCSTLREWATGLPELPEDCTFFNFTASHDGIGIRPLHGRVSDDELTWLVEQMKSRGGKINYRSNPDGSTSPYELNITYLDALSEPNDTTLGTQRFLCSQAVTLAFKGIPAVYINSLAGGRNHLAGVAQTGQNRTINRQKWTLAELEDRIDLPASIANTVFSRITRMIKKRASHPAFHPDSPQRIIPMGDRIFCLLRGSTDGPNWVLCLFNFSGKRNAVRNVTSKAGISGNFRLQDLIGRKSLDSPSSAIVLQPYQAVWLTPQAE